MNTQEAAEILRALADGVDPFTGEIFPDDSPYQKPQVIRALFLALSVMEGVPKGRKVKRVLPENAGKPWEQAEDELLSTEFDAGTPVDEIARRHKRTEGAIRARLVRIGKITERSLADSVLASIRQRKTTGAS